MLKEHSSAWSLYWLCRYQAELVQPASQQPVSVTQTSSQPTGTSQPASQLFNLPTVQLARQPDNLCSVLSMLVLHQSLTGHLPFLSHTPSVSVSLPVLPRHTHSQKSVKSGYSSIFFLQKQPKTKDCHPAPTSHTPCPATEHLQNNQHKVICRKLIAVC